MRLDEIKQYDVVVIGASGGIGKAVCQKLERENKTVFGVDIKDGAYVNHLVDASDFSALSELLAKNFDSETIPRTFICCAGLYHRKALEDYGIDDIDEVFRNNFLSTTNIVKNVVDKYCDKQHEFNFVLLSSLAGHFGGFDPYYAAAKSAVMSFAKSVAREYQRYKIRVNVIAPGPTNTNMSNVMSEARKAYYLEQIPTGNYVEAKEIADLAYFLAFGSNSSINGAIFDIDGGLIRR